MRAALIALACVVVAVPAQASPHDQLEQAGKAFQARDWQSAKQIANDLLYPPPAQLGSQNDVIEAYLILGASAFELGDTPRARQEFENALKLDPDKILTTFTFSQGAVRLFEETRAELKTRAERDAERKRLAARQAALENYLKNTRFVETHQYYLNFMPFGAMGNSFEVGCAEWHSMQRAVTMPCTVENATGALVVADLTAAEDAGAAVNAITATSPATAAASAA